MARIFITGSSDGLGLLAAKSLVSLGHKVVLHARNEERAEKINKELPAAESVVIGDLRSLEETKQLATSVNNTGKFDAVIHNAGIYTASPNEILSVNVMAPYVLTCMIEKPERLVYLSSDMHLGGHIKSGGFQNKLAGISYSDSKLLVLMLSKIIAARWHNVYSNAVNPGWVPTKMGGPGAPDDLQKGYETQVWLSVSNEKAAMVSGKYFFHKKESRYNPQADEAGQQDMLLKLCREITGLEIPE